MPTFVNIDGTYHGHHTPVALTKSLPAGAYKISQNLDQSINFHEHKVSADSLIALPHSPVGNVTKIIDTFMEKETAERYAKAGLCYKRGVLLYGPPGSGKTAANRMITLDAVNKHNAIVLINPHPSYVRNAAEAIEKVEGAPRRMLVVWEEFDAWIASGRVEVTLLDLMDGTDQMTNTLFLASTNKFEAIPKRFTSRPSRFADIVYLGLPNALTRRDFAAAKAKEMGLKVDPMKVAKDTEGMSLDGVKNFLIFVAFLGVSPKAAREKIMGEPANRLGKIDIDLESMSPAERKEYEEADKKQTAYDITEMMTAMFGSQPKASDESDDEEEI